MDTVKTNKIAFYIGEFFVVVFLLTLVMGITTFFRKSYSVPVASEFPTMPFTTNYSGTTVNYVSDAFSQCTGTDCNLLINSNGSAVDSFKVPLSYATSDSSKALYILSKNLGFASNTETIGNNSTNPSVVNDAGIRYIINHGYYDSTKPGDIFDGTYGQVNDNKIKQYLTQMALWVYIYEKSSTFTDLCASTKDTNVTGCNFNYEKSDGTTNTYTTIPAANVTTLITNASGSDGYEYLKYALELVDGAKSATDTNSYDFDDMPESSFYIQDNVLTSTLVTPVSSNPYYQNYSLTLTDPNHYGAYLIDSSGAKITNLNNRTGSFKLVVPVSDYGAGMDLTSVQVDITGHFTKLVPYRYFVTDTSSDNAELINNNKMNNFSDIMLSVNDYNTASINLQPQNFTLISKVDVTNSKELPGARLTISAASNNTVLDEWTSTNEPHAVMLENGDYKLCETTSPSGYAQSTECINFTVTNSKVEKVVMENAPIPDTGASMYKGIYYIGSLLLLIGIGVVTTLIFKEKHIKNTNNIGS